MPRDHLPPLLSSLITQARDVVEALECIAVFVLADVPYDFDEIQKLLVDTRLIVASPFPEVLESAKSDGITVVPLVQEPQTRQVQLSQTLLEAIADNLVKTGDRIVALYSGYERESIDTLSVINLSERLARLTARDLQRLETQVPLTTLRRVVDLAVEIGREGRENKKVGTLFVVGQHRKVLEMSHEAVHDAFKGYSKKERAIANPRVCESIKELAQIDGAFIISADGYAMACGRMLDVAAAEVTLSKGLGARHWAAAAITKTTSAIAIAVSESTGTVRIFQNGTVVLRIEPMLQAMKWHDVDTDPPQERPSAG